MKFKYRRFDVEPSPTAPDGCFYRPMIPIRVIGPVADWAFFAYVDTGADETTFAESVSHRIGLAVNEKQALAVTGFGGQSVQGLLGELEIEVKQGTELFRWKQTVRFARFARPEDEVGILGHVGFLNYFTATFNGKKRELTLKANGTFPKVDPASQ